MVTEGTVSYCVFNRGVGGCGQVGEGHSEPKEVLPGFFERVVGVVDPSFCGNSIQIKLAGTAKERFPNQQTQHD